MMNKILESEINALVTEHILTYHSQLISTGQIKDVALKGPSAIRLPSHCNPSGRMRLDALSEDLAPLQGEPLQSNLGVDGHE